MTFVHHPDLAAATTLFPTVEAALEGLQQGVEGVTQHLGPTVKGRQATIYLTLEGPDELSGIYEEASSAHTKIATLQASDTLLQALHVLTITLQQSTFGRNNPGLHLRLALIKSGKCALSLMRNQQPITAEQHQPIKVVVQRLRVLLRACALVGPKDGPQRFWLPSLHPSSATYHANNVSDALLIAVALYQSEGFDALITGTLTSVQPHPVETHPNLTDVVAAMPRHLHPS